MGGLTKQIANLPHKISCGNSSGTPKFTPRKILWILHGDPDAPSPEGNIRMKNKEKPLPQKGAYLVVRDRIHTPPKILSAGTPKIYPTKFPAEIVAGTPARNGL